jgi:hypothetical protein
MLILRQAALGAAPAGISQWYTGLNMERTMRISLVSALLVLGSPVFAQEAIPTDFTTPEGAAFIHQTIKDTALSFRQEGAEDYIYFTNLIAWRCGVVSLTYGVNGEAPSIPFPMEPCWRELREPNTMKMENPAFALFLKVPAGSVQTVTLRFLYEDGKVAEFVVERSKNLIY